MKNVFATTLTVVFLMAAALLAPVALLVWIGKKSLAQIGEVWYS